MLTYNNKRPQAIALAVFALSLLPLIGSGAVAAPPTAQTPSKPRLLTDPVPDPQQPDVVWFGATGHTLRGAFLEYWNKYGGLAQFGYPLTEEFAEPVGPDNKQHIVQYFERNRFEHHPENKGTQYEVLLGALGRDFHEPDPPAPVLPGASYFPETGHNLDGVFRDYWHSQGGLFVHGYPITEEFQEKNPIDGKTYTVQYFERSRFEHHPENVGTHYEVLLGLLGTQLAQKKGYPYGWYPVYGHATDFSWVSGYVPYVTGCTLPECWCTFDSDPRVEPVGPGWKEALNMGKVRFNTLLVLFGRLAGPEEPASICPAPGYSVDRVQANPSE